MSKTKHKYHDLILAWLDGKTIERLNIDGEWVETIPLSKNGDLPGFYENYEYRMKKDTERIPFSTLEQISKVIGVKIKTDNSLGMITGAYIGVNVNGDEVLYIYTGEATEAITADQLFTLFTFMNGKPCGILLEE